VSGNCDYYRKYPRSDALLGLFVVNVEPAEHLHALRSQFHITSYSVLNFYSEQKRNGAIPFAQANPVFSDYKCVIQD